MAGTLNSRNLTGTDKHIEYGKASPRGKFQEYFPFFRKWKFREIWVKGDADLSFFIFVFLLLCIGLVMVFSSSYVFALNDSSDRVANNPYYYIQKQLMFSVMGLVAMYIFSRISHNFIKEFSVLLLVVSVILLVVVLFYYVELDGRAGIKRFIRIPLVGQFQPSEVAKLGLIMFCAWSMEKKHKLLAKKVTLAWPYMLAIIVLSGLVFLENHLSGTVLMLCIGIAMLFFGGIKLRWFLIFGIPVLIIGGVLVYALWAALNAPEEAASWIPERFVEWGRNPDNADYRLMRVVAWLKKDFQPVGARWQTNNSLYAIASGGIFGKGPGNSLQKHLYLSEAHNDFIYSVICEEFGFIGALAVMSLFGLLVWRGFIIASKAKDRFGSLLVLGIVFQVGLQAAIHIAVVTDTIPNTGISLPFISYGGTSLLILLAEMGMVLAVSRTANMNKT